MIMLLHRRPKNGTFDRYLLPCLIGLVTVIVLSGDIVNAQRYSETPPRYSYDRLPKTGFTCKGKLPGRYYPDPETDCQMFHVCVKMNHRDTSDFKFLCPNGTVFDSEHQVCMDYYQVVCHSASSAGTNPLGQIFEIFKISSGQTRDLDADKLSFVYPDSIERNTLGDDFQVEENNNNRLASSQNALNFRSSPPAPTQSKTTKSHKAKEDIFFNNKGFVPSNFGSYQSSTTRRPSTTRSTTTTTTTTTTEAPSSSTPRRPSLETFESYETESFSGFIPSRNSFGSEQRSSSPPDFDASTEDFTPKDEVEQYRPKPTTTTRPYIFQNTFRTTLSHAPSTARPAVQQTFQQQASRFNDDYFTRIPSTTRRPVSKAAQFFLHSTVVDDYYTPEYRQSTETPFRSNRRHHQPRTTSTSTTLRPSLVFQSNSGTVRPRFSVTGTTVDYQYETSTLPTTTQRATTTTTTTEVPTTTEFFGRHRQQEEDFEARQTTSYNNEFSRSTNFFNSFDNQKQRKDNFGGKSTTPPRNFPPQLSPQYVEEESLRPRNIHGSTNAQNSLKNESLPPQPSTQHRDNFGFSTVPPPTTAEPFSTPPPTTAAAALTEQETAQTLAARLQNQLFKKTTTTKNPEKYSIFFGRSTHSVSDDRLPSPGPTTSYNYDSGSSTPRPRHRVRSTTSSPDFEQTSQAVTFDRRRLSRFGLVSTTVAPEANNGTKPLRRGVRRRLRPVAAGDRPNGKDFDPELKYKRRRFESARVNNEGLAQKNDEIFNAEASVFRGDPSINLFKEQRKVENPGSQKIEQTQKQTQQKQQRQPENHYERNYGRRVRPNGGDEQQNINDNEGAHNNQRGNVPANRVNNGEGPRNQPLPPGNGPQLRRRVVKRIRPKTTTPEPGSIHDADTIPQKKQFVVTGSTLRPVTRINVKTKLGGKISTTFRTTEITDGLSSPTPSSTTTKEPELVTASDDEIEKIRYKTSSPAPNFKNDSHLVIKLISDKPLFPPSPTFPSSPFSIKKPIISTSANKKPSFTPAVSIKPAGTKKSQNSRNEEESNTRSPDYDYAYYNSDDGSDYDAETSSLDHKNYGRKPNRQHSK